jgi:hypothetical protein
MDCISAMTSAMVAGLLDAISPLPGEPAGDADEVEIDCLPENRQKYI